MALLHIIVLALALVALSGTNAVIIDVPVRTSGTCKATTGIIRVLTRVHPRFIPDRRNQVFAWDQLDNGKIVSSWVSLGKPRATWTFNWRPCTSKPTCPDCDIRASCATISRDGLPKTYWVKYEPAANNGNGGTFKASTSGSDATVFWIYKIPNRNHDYYVYVSNDGRAIDLPLDGIKHPEAAQPLTAYTRDNSKGWGDWFHFEGTSGDCM